MCLVAVSALVVVAATPPVRVPELVQQLGHPDFRRREAASRQLASAGPDALPALEAAARSPDHETSRRARQLARSIRRRADDARLLAPTLVELDCVDMPASEVLTILEKQAGCRFLSDARAARLTDRRLTLRTGRVPFWEAFEQLGAAAGLAEAADPRLRYLLGVPNTTNTEFVRRKQPPPAAFQRVQTPEVNLLTPIRGKIALTERVSDPLPAQRGGAVRVRVAGPLGMGAPPSGQLRLYLAVDAEPRIAGISIAEVTIDQASDEHGQALTPVATDSSTPFSSTPLATPARPALAQGTSDIAAVRLLAGKTPSKRLRDLRGTLGLELRVPETLAVADEVLKRRGTARGKSGTWIEVQKAEKIAEGYQLEVQVHYPVEVQPDTTDPHALQRGQSGSALRGLAVLDAAGEPVEVTNIPRSHGRFDGKTWTCTLVMNLRVDFGKGPPARVEFRGTGVRSVRLPFVLTDIPLE